VCIGTGSSRAKLEDEHISWVDDQNEDQSTYCNIRKRKENICMQRLPSVWSVEIDDT
jgi:hypothetical protein